MAPCAHYHPISTRGGGNQCAPSAPPCPPQPQPNICPPEDPPMNRYCHPIVPQGPFAREELADLHFLRCALAYQNQVLADIKTLLQTLVEQTASSDG